MGQTPQIRAYELIKINVEDLTDAFNRKLEQVSPLLRKSMVRAYRTALQDSQYLLMAAEKDTKNGSPEAPK